MKHLRKLLLAAAAVLAFAAGVVAQSITSQTLTGNETIVGSIGGPQGTSIFIPVSQLRNASSLRTFVGLSGTQTYTAQTTDSVLYWVGTAPSTWTITTPAAPWDGQIIQIATDTTLTSLVTLTANTGQSLNSTFSSQTISAKTSVEFMFQASTNKWFQMR